MSTSTFTIYVVPFIANNGEIKSWTLIFERNRDGIQVESEDAYPSPGTALDFAYKWCADRHVLADISLPRFM